MNLLQSLFFVVLVGVVLGKGQVEEYRLDVEEGVLSDLRERLERVRLPRVVDEVGWERGMEVGYLTELIGMFQFFFFYFQLAWRLCFLLVMTFVLSYFFLVLQSIGKQISIGENKRK